MIKLLKRSGIILLAASCSILFPGGLNPLNTIALTGSSISIANPRQPFSLTNPSGKPDFSAAQIAAQKANGTNILNAIIAAAGNLSISEYVIPAGNYGFSQTFWKNATTSAFLLNGIKRPASNPFTIKAYGVTFWFDTMGAPAPTWGRAVHFNDCENLILEGLTIDTYVRNAIEGTLTTIDKTNNRIEISLLDGTFKDEAKILAYPDAFDKTANQNRIIPVKPNGNLIAPLYNINNQWGPEYLFINGITKSATDKYWLTFRSTELLNTIFTPAWQNAYGSEGTLAVGDGISLIYGVMGGVVIDNSKQITIKDTNCYIAKGSIFEGGGYGNHKWINVHFSPRPGTNQILGGGENMSEGLRVGSSYENCYFGLTSDDAINMHGFWGVAQSMNGNSVVFDRVPSGVSAGDSVEFYQTTDGSLISSHIIQSIIKKPDTDINGNMHDVTITFTQAPDASIVTSNSTIWARYPNAECAGWLIQNCVFESNYQRILLQSGPGVFENNIVNSMGSGLHMTGNFYSYEAGWPHQITIRNNTFLNSSLCPDETPILLEFANKTSQNQWATDINIINNLFVNSGAEVIRLKNAKNILLDGNITTNPLSYTAIAMPSLPRASTIFTGENVSSVRVQNNRLFENSSQTSGNRFFNQTATMSNNIASVDSVNYSSPIAKNTIEAYTAQYTSPQIIDFVTAPAETASDSSTLDNLSVVNLPFTENFTKNAIGSLWSYDESHYRTIENANSVAGKSILQDFAYSEFGGMIYAFAFKNKLTAGGTYRLSVSYKVLTDSMPSQFYFGFTRDGGLNQKNTRLDFEGNVKNTIYTFTREYTLDNFGDYYLQWFNLNGADGTKIVIDSLSLERLAAPTPVLTINDYNVLPGNTITGFAQKMKPSDFVTGLATRDGVRIRFFGSAGNEQAANAYVTTNTTMTVTLDGSTLATYKLVLKGDLDWDGVVSISDLAMIRSHLLKIATLTGITQTAGDIYSKSSVSISDLLAVKKMILQ